MLAVMAGLETGSLVDTTERIAVLAGVVMLVESVVDEALALGEDAPMPFKMKLPILSVDEDGGNGEGVVDAARVMEVKEFDDSVRCQFSCLDLRRGVSSYHLQHVPASPILSTKGPSYSPVLESAETTVIIEAKNCREMEI
jgi:hypothetical protein